MNNVIDFKKALAAKRYEQHGLRQVLPNEFVKKALAAGRAANPELFTEKEKI
jgi:hypothetical protein